MAYPRPKRPAHFLFRYSDNLMNVDTFAEHKKLEQKYGYVWWGKFGLGVSQSIVDRVKKQIEDDQTSHVYLAVGGTVKYRAKLLDLKGGGGRASIGAPESKTVPRYYRHRGCSVWFKLSDFQATKNDVVKTLTLLNDPSSHPQMLGMRALIYVQEIR